MKFWQWRSASNDPVRWRGLVNTEASLRELLEGL
jgi:hypothetical protein